MEVILGMQEIKYFKAVAEKAKSDLLKSYDYRIFLKKDTDIINAFLIDQIMNECSAHLYIQPVLKYRNANYYLPVLFSVAASSFLFNFCDNKNSNNYHYIVGETLYDKKGRKHTIQVVEDNYIELQYKIPKARGGGVKTIRKFKNELKNYACIRADKEGKLKTKNHRTRKTCLYDFKTFFDNLFKTAYYPSNFTHKSVIILKKKVLFEQLQSNSCGELNFNKIIPYKWITNNENDINIADNINIEPLIYFASDYNTVKEKLEDKDITIESIVFIGKSKYTNDLSKIKKDIRRGKVKRTIFIGMEKVSAISNIKKWCWTSSEFKFFTKSEINNVKCIDIFSEGFEYSFDRYINALRNMSSENSINLSHLISYSYKLYSFIASIQEERLIRQINYEKAKIEELAKSYISEKLYQIDIDPSDIINNSLIYLEDIFKNMCCAKFIKVITTGNIDILVVPSFLKTTWITVLSHYSHMDKTLCLSFNEFLNSCNDNEYSRNVMFLSIFGYRVNPYCMIEKLISCNDTISILTYREEKKIYGGIIEELSSKEAKEFGSDDRFNFTNIEFIRKSSRVPFTKIINRDYNFLNNATDITATDHSEDINFRLRFEDLSIETYEGSKSVILENENFEPVKIQVSQLSVDDRIRIYENTKREHLLEIAINNDEKGVFSRIKKYSMLWKRALKNYYNTKHSSHYDENNLLRELIENNAKLTLPTLRNWLDPKSHNLYPTHINNIKVIALVTKSELLRKDIENVITYRRKYRSIMISLGHNLSDELTDYVISEKQHKGMLLKELSNNQIEKFLNETAPVKRIINIEMIRGKNE